MGRSKGVVKPDKEKRKLRDYEEGKGRANTSYAEETDDSTSEDGSTEDSDFDIAILFPTIPGKAAWNMELYANMDDYGGYAWAEAVWQFIVEGLDKLSFEGNTTQKEAPVQGFSLLLQCWLYEHSKVLTKKAPKKFTRIYRWCRPKLKSLSGSNEYELLIHVLKPMAYEEGKTVVNQLLQSDEWKIHLVEVEQNLSSAELARRACERVLKLEKKIMNKKKNSVDIIKSKVGELDEILVNLTRENAQMRDRVRNTKNSLDMSPGGKVGQVGTDEVPVVGTDEVPVEETPNTENKVGGGETMKRAIQGNKPDGSGNPVQAKVFDSKADGKNEEVAKKGDLKSLSTSSASNQCTSESSKATEKKPSNVSKGRTRNRARPRGKIGKR